MTEQETAEALRVTERTVRRDWVKARGLLYQALGPTSCPALAHPSPIGARWRWARSRESDGRVVEPLLDAALESEPGSAPHFSRTRAVGCAAARRGRCAARGL